MGNLLYLCAVLFLFMVQSALFSPAKLGILPEMLKEEELSKGNGFMQSWTFVGIILGTAAGGILYKIFHSHIYYIGGLMSVLALIGFGVSFFIHAQRGSVVLLNQKFLSGTWEH